MREACEFGGQCKVRESRHFVLPGAERNLRHAMVRAHDRRQRVLQRLEALDASLQPVAVAVVLQEAFALDRGLRGLPNLREQVDEVAAVGNAVEIEPAEEVRRESVLVVERHAVAVDAGALVVRQVLEARLAGVLGVQVAELGLQLRAALAEIPRRDRRVVLRRDIPVERRAELQAAARGLRIAGREEPGLAAFFQREGHPRQVRDRVVEEYELAVAHRRGLLFVIELERAGLDAPVVAARLAGGERPVAQGEAVLAEELDALGLAARRLVAAADRERGGLNHAGPAGRVVLQSRAGKTVHPLLQPHAALGFDAVEFLVELDLVAEDRGVVLLQLGLVPAGDLDVHYALDAPRIEIGRAFFLGGRRFRRGLLRPQLEGECCAPHGETRRGKHRKARRKKLHVVVWTGTKTGLVKSHNSRDLAM